MVPGQGEERSSSTAYPRNFFGQALGLLNSFELQMLSTVTAVMNSHVRGYAVTWVAARADWRDLVKPSKPIASTPAKATKTPPNPIRSGKLYDWLAVDLTDANIGEITGRKTFSREKSSLTRNALQEAFQRLRM